MGLLPEIKNQEFAAPQQGSITYDLVPKKKYSALIQAPTDPSEESKTNRITVFQRNSAYEEVSHASSNKLVLIKKCKLNVHEMPAKSRNNNSATLKSMEVNQKSEDNILQLKPNPLAYTSFYSNNNSSEEQEEERTQAALNELQTKQV